MYSSEWAGRPTFAGHETFPLRAGWLKKAFDAVHQRKPVDAARHFRVPEAMADFGVGKNMVTSIRFWGLATAVLQETREGIAVSDFAKQAFGARGFDPYLEQLDTLWWLHWTLVGRGSATRQNVRAATWFAAFNFLDVDPFGLSDIMRSVANARERLGWELPQETTLDRDSKCFIRCYLPSDRSEEGFGSPLVALHLIAESDARGWYQFVRGPKPSLSQHTLWKMIEDYWSMHPSQDSLLVEDITTGIGSPGRALKLDRETIWALLPRIAALSGNAVTVADLGGRAQLVRDHRSSSKTKAERQVEKPAAPMRVKR